MANCNKCKSNRCGCGDSALSVPATFSNCPTVCPPDSEKCTELFLAECICWPGPDICELDVKTGDRLDEIFRKVILTVSQISCKVGLPGENGASAYEQWLSYGNVGTEQEFLASLIGVDGVDGINGVDGTDGTDGTNGTNGTDGTIISLTTVGTSGPSSLAGGVLNIPEYAGGGFDGVFTDVDIAASVTMGGSATSTINSFGLSYYIVGKTAFISFNGSVAVTGSIGDTIFITSIDLSAILPSNIKVGSWNRFGTGTMFGASGLYNPIAVPIFGAAASTILGSSQVILPIAMTADNQFFYGQMTLSIT